MIKTLKVDIGARRDDKEQTRRMCKLVVNGESRGRLSLSFKEATQLQILLERCLPPVKS